MGTGPEGSRRTGVAVGGFMGVGKSTVGRLLADRLGLAFVDLDVAISAQAGMDIPSIFASEGEAGFRRRERAMLLAHLQGPDVVLALGGGTLHHADNAARLRARFPVVVLDLPWAQVQLRLAGSVDRPLASAAHDLWLARRAGYQSAGTVIDVTGLDIEATVDAVMEALC